MTNTLPDFAHVIRGADLEPRFQRFESFAGLIFDERDPGDADREILIGCVGSLDARVTLGDLRALVPALAADFAKLGLQPGMTVALARFPRTSELLVAVAYIALSAWGVRVFFPMHLDGENLVEWLRLTGAHALLANFEELDSPLTLESDRIWGKIARTAAGQAGARVLCLDRDLHLSARVLGPLRSVAPGAVSPDWKSWPGIDQPCAVLTTSGTTSRSRLVEYTQGAFLRSCAAWEQAGLFDPSRLGGRAFCPLLGHSMGIRSLWNAVWTRQPLIFISPEWFLEHPSRIPGLLLRTRPEHVTGGPAVFSVLLEFAKYFPRLERLLFREIRCLVSSGSPYDAKTASRLRETFGLVPHNALGTTETQQITTTLLNTAAPGPGALGTPLPGVHLGLQRREDLSEGQSALWVKSPFACVGYLGEHTPAREGWWPTGDLVRIEDGELLFSGRESQDFFKDSFGVKIPRLRLRELYGSLFPEADGIEFVPLREEPGLAAIIFAPNGTGLGGSEIESAFVGRLDELRTELEDFEQRHFAVRRFLILPEKAPRNPKGEVSRRKVLENWDAEIASLTGTASGAGRARSVRPRSNLKDLGLTALELARVAGVRMLLTAGWKGGQSR